MSTKTVSVTEQKRRASVLNDIDSIYYVYPISFEKVDLEKTLDENIETFEKIHGCKVIDRDKYLKYLHMYGEDKVSISGFISSFHVKEGEAMRYAIENVGDINEAGCYNYCAVVRAPIGYSYYNTEQRLEEDIKILQYNRDTDKYETLDKSAKEYDVIAYHVWGMYYNTDRLSW